MNFNPVNKNQQKEMLKTIGKGIADLLSAIPEEMHLKSSLNLPSFLSEMAIKEETLKTAKLNKDLIVFAGGGVYDHYVPSAIGHLTGMPEFYTSYTPYQPEVSQGTLQAIYEYQSMICELTGMEVSNASIYDGATALGEAIFMAFAINSDRNKVVVSEGINPYYIEVIKTYLGENYLFETLSLKDGITDTDQVSKIDEGAACIAIQHPNFLGNLEEVEEFVKVAQEHDVIVVLHFDPISLGILKTPGEYRVDIATAEGQCLGVHMNLGGPYLGILTSMKKHIRSMPGRIAGKTVDKKGKEGYVMVLQTREQHIRREKATSNICTNQQLCALSSAIYLALHGWEGIREIANKTTQKAHYLAEILQKAGLKLPYKQKFFREFVVEIPAGAEKAIKKGVKKGYLAGINLGKFKKEWRKHLLVSVTEKRTKNEMDELARILSSI
ncbi:aminomethyl-transferring glycine dehydrogenase subunit GcvPA [candidate division WOR-3 bacterium]|nr:aminomethyl-transferring glycine dehydrogenase subunit GcvPA [candidate division WOR-3 bacterium]